jgi:macrolide transport system ATP-binding/permease protein
MAPRLNPLLRLIYAAIDAGRWLAPPSRRREWRRQWRADVAHAWQRMERQDRGVAARAGLLARVAGAFRHAFWLRMHVRGLDMITQDLRYGWRLMVQKPAFTLVAVLTLGLGIGANVSMYSWLDGRLRHLLEGVEHADRIVALNTTLNGRTDGSISWPTFADLRERRPDSVEDLIAYTLAPLNMRLGDGDPQRVFAEFVSVNYFAALGARPLLGRAFLADEGLVPNRHAVAVISYKFWTRRFGRDPSIVGRTIWLNGIAFTIVGVGPETFSGTEPYLNLDLWVPVLMQPALSGVDRLIRGNRWLEVMIRLKPGVTLERAEADLDLVMRQLGQTYAEEAGSGVKLYELWRAPSMGGAVVTAVMGVQLAVAGIVLLIACANVANLLLARAATRQRETAVRLTLGASRGRLVQQMLTESTLLALAGGIVGTLFAYWTKDLARLFVPPAPLPIDINVTLNPQVFAFAGAVTIVTALLFGLVPAVQGAASSVMSALKESALAVTASPRRARARQTLVVAQVALSLMLLVSAGLFLRTLVNAQSVDPGFSTRRGLFAAIDLQPAGYDPARGSAFYAEMLNRVRGMPGVDAASVATRVPLGFGSFSSLSATIDEYTPARNEEILVSFNRIGPDYLKTMGIPLVEGREFTDLDTSDRGDVAIVNETLARRYFAGRSPIGGHIRLGPRRLEIVGVARDGKYGSITETPRPFLYVALQQMYRADAVLHVKTAGDPLAMAPPLQEAFRSLDPNVPLFDLRTVAEHLEVAVFVQRMVASLLTAFGALALLLATVGLYGVIATLSAQRTPEIGMRMALGATRADIVVLILKQGLGLTLVGVVVGLAGAIGTTRLFETLLVGVSATDVASFAGTTALLVLVALAATYVPARRASRIDPLQALKNE